MSARVDPAATVQQNMWYFLTRRALLEKGLVTDTAKSYARQKKTSFGCCLKKLQHSWGYSASIFISIVCRNGALVRATNLFHENRTQNETQPNAEITKGTQWRFRWIPPARSVNLQRTINHIRTTIDKLQRKCIGIYILVLLTWIKAWCYWPTHCYRFPISQSWYSPVMTVLPWRDHFLLYFCFKLQT